jgi:PAS domain S-box-containing protein
MFKRNKTLHILFLEESGSARDETARLLEAENIALIGKFIANETELHDAISAYRTNKAIWDIAICSGNLSGMDCAAAVRLIRKHIPELPVIALMNSVGEEAVEVMRAGASDVILRLNTDRLLPAIENALQQAENERQRRTFERLHRKQNHVLELMALGLPLQEVLTAAALLLEERFPGAAACILIRDEENDRLLLGAAPHLTPEFQSALDGIAISGEESACARAVNRGETTVITDIARNPLPDSWLPLKEAALSVGLYACWSQPIFTVEDEVLGTFALFFSAPAEPQEGQLALLREATFLPRIAIERFRSEERLRRQEERYRRAVGQANAALYHLDRTAPRYLFMGDRIQELTGYSAEEFTPGLFRTLVREVRLPGEPNSTTPDEIRERSLPKILPSWSADYRIQTRSGEERWLSDVSIDATAPNSSRLEAIGLLMDITERKAAERAIDRERQRIETILESMTDSLVVVDRAGNYLYLNPQAEKFLRRTPGELLGKNIWDEYQELVGTSLGDNLACALADDRPSEFEGVYAPLDASLELRVFPTQEGYSIYFREITEKKRLEAQVIQSAKLAAMGELVSGVTHEINNPLSAIRGNAQLMAMHYDPDVRADAEAIVAMADRIGALVRSLLHFARRGGSENRRFHVNDIVQSALELARLKLRQTGVHVRQELDDALPEVFVKSNQIEQIVLNLLTNAEYAVRGLPAEQRWVTIQTGERPAALDRSRRIYIRVNDSGGGIPSDVLPHIFEPFYTTKNQEDGTGLGLSICRGIAQEHGGQLLAENLPEGGASFTLLLPLADEAAPSRSVPSPTASQIPYSRREVA